MTPGRLSHPAFPSLLFAGLLVGLCVFYVVRNQSSGYDDSFITYRYADNLRHGYGLVFNSGERHYGSTAMGLAVVLGGLSIVLGSIGLGDIASIARCLSALSLALIAFVLSRIMMRLITHRWVAYLVSVTLSLYILAAPVSNEAVGHETYPFIAILALSAFLIFFKKQYSAGAICLGISPMLRPDCVVFIALIILILIARQHAWHDVGKNKVLVVSIVSGLLVISWVTFTTIYFGSPIPETMVAKKAERLFGYWPLFRLKVVEQEMLNRLTVSLGVVLIVGVLATSYGVFKSMRHANKPLLGVHSDALCWSLTLMLFAIALVLSYRQFRVTYWPWYFLPIYFSVLFSTMIATVDLATQYRRLSRDLIIVGLTALALDGPTAVKGLVHWIVERPVNIHFQSYDPIVAYLRAHEPNGTILATAEPGNLGYKLGPRFTIVDELGLASPGVARHILAGDLDYPFRRWKPQYVIVSWLGKQNPHERWWFDRLYEKVGEFQHPFWRDAVGRGALLYRRLSESTLVLEEPKPAPK